LEQRSRALERPKALEGPPAPDDVGRHGEAGRDENGTGIHGLDSGGIRREAPDPNVCAVGRFEQERVAPSVPVGRRFGGGTDGNERPPVGDGLPRDGVTDGAEEEL
jgi:hypothetical protein